MKRILDEEIRKFSDSQFALRIKSFLREPQPRQLHWTWNNCSERYLGWLVADMGERNVWIAYCEQGWGTRGRPWGLVFEKQNFIGEPDAWYPSLQALFEDGWAGGSWQLES